MGEGPVSGIVEGCESGGEDSTDVVQRRSGVEVGAIRETLNMAVGDVFRRTFDLPEESVWVWCPVFRVQTVSKRTNVQYETWKLGGWQSA